MPKKLKLALVLFAVFLLVENMIVINLMNARKKAPPVKKTPAGVAAKKTPKKPPVFQGNIAIVLDDWGYNLNSLPFIEEIKYPLTISILPYLPYSKTVAGELHARGFELILHLPLEPHERFSLEHNTIMTTMKEDEILAILRKNLEDIPFVKGVNNHMGSKATTDEKTMGVIFGELKKRRLYFLDSFVSLNSVCAGLAERMNIPFAKRDIFLDNKSDPEYIKAQLYKLKTKAKMYGEAIGIGHDRKTTVQVLREMMPVLEREGYRFVFVSQLLN
ncbi:MAG: divergent polysaccharide deacetylase family protein [Candidatus Omnitrophica bacterium]|nr:divergent polysaccharide deacetylase family protein [Candidatus Omnitrophota bacterium]